MNAMKEISNSRWLAPLLSAGLFCGAVVMAFGQAETDVRRDATVQAIERVMPSVVNIATVSVVPVTDPFEARLRQFYRRQLSDTLYSLGSGVIIDEAGYLLTNEHVVRGASQIGVQFNAGTNQYYEAMVIAKDPQRDIALLKLDTKAGEKFRAIKLAREDDLLLGETVIALGNPYGLGGSVTRGILSSKSRIVPQEGVRMEVPWLQTDAPINEGNSGGPLINLRGELIGINVRNVPEAQSIGFAIPIRVVEEALADILPTEYVKSWWFGARVKVGSCPLAITSVQADSPAGHAGLKSGDVVLQVNGKVPKNFIDFGELLATNASAVTITFRRGEDVSDVQLKLVPEKSVFNADLVRTRLGLSLQTLTPETAARFHVNATGFVVTGVQEDSPAGKGGLQERMLILAVDGQVITDLNALAKLLYDKKKDDKVVLNCAALQSNGVISFWAQGPKELLLR